MLDKTKFMALHYYDYGETFGGSYRGMEYRFGKEKDENDNPVLRAWIWPGPYNFIHTKREKKIWQDFPFSEEGKDAAVDWLEKMRAEKTELFDKIPSILDVEPCQAEDA